jgi:hypothetical protein
MKWEKIIKYLIAYEICKPNLKWNYDKNQNRKIIKNLLKWIFLIFLIFLSNFNEKFEIKDSLKIVYISLDCWAEYQSCIMSFSS